MSSITTAILSIAFALASNPTCGAQQPSDAPPAPIPSQIFTAKKAFISNASGDNASASPDPNLVYNEFYAALKSWKRYDLVAAPADADLIFEIRYIIALGEVVVSNQAPPSLGGSVKDPEVILIIRDPKTNTVLWAFNESIHKEKRQTGRQAFDQTVAKVVDDLKKLAVQPAAAATAP